MLESTFNKAPSPEACFPMNFAKVLTLIRLGFLRVVFQIDPPTSPFIFQEELI